MSYLDWVVIGTIIAFFAVSAAMLWPIHRFLEREEEASKQWMRRPPDAADLHDLSTKGDGAPAETDAPDTPTPS